MGEKVSIRHFCITVKRQLLPAQKSFPPERGNTRGWLANFVRSQAGAWEREDVVT